MTDKEKDEILEIFINPRIDLIKKVIYFDGWSGYEDCAGLLIFYGIDDSIQRVTWSSSGYGSNYEFEPIEISYENMLEEIKEMEESILNNSLNF
jgi:hypothetical protein